MEEYQGTRRIKRRELDASVKLKVHESSAAELKLLKNEIIARTSDISDNGLGISCPLYIPEGTLLNVALGSESFYPGKKEPIHIVAKVTSTTMVEGEYRIGLQLIEISDQDRKALINYVQK